MTKSNRSHYATLISLSPIMPRKKRPINELVASNADESYAAQVEEIVRKVEATPYEWMLITQQLIFPCEANLHSSRESLIADMAGALACHYNIVAVHEAGRPITEAELKSMQAEALGGLGPISKARAEGRL